MNLKITFSSGDGLKLAGVWDTPDKPTTKAIVLAHGITVDKDENGIFIELATRLVQEGFAVFRFDFRGHGESEGKSVGLTISREIEDLESAIDVVQKEGYTHIGLLGASFGGGIAALTAPKHQEVINALCLWNPVLNYDHIFLNPTVSWLKSQKEQMLDEVQKQGWTTLGSKKMVIGKALYEEMKHYSPFKTLKLYNNPCLIIHGTKDSKVPYEDSKEYGHFLKNGILIIIEDAEHGFHKDWETKRALDGTMSFFQKNIEL